MRQQPVSALPLLLWVLMALLVREASHAGPHPETDFHIEEPHYELDFPEGRCGGHAPTGVLWTAPDNLTVDIVGAAWKMRNSSNASVTIWVKGKRVLDRFYVPHWGETCNSKKPYLPSRMLESRGESSSALKNIALRKGQAIVIEIGDNDYLGLDLTISGGGQSWGLARDGLPIDLEVLGSSELVLFEEK